MSSYTSSSKGRAEDSCSLWREYLSWRRSPTSLMTFSACGDIYTMKKKKKKNAVSLKANMKSEDVYRCRDTSLVKPNCKLGPKQERSLVWTFTFYFYYLGVRAKWWVHTDTSSKQQQIVILSKALQLRGTYSLWAHELWLMQLKCYSSSCYSIRSTIITQCRDEYIYIAEILMWFCFVASCMFVSSVLTLSFISRFLLTWGQSNKLQNKQPFKKF